MSKIVEGNVDVWVTEYSPIGPHNIDKVTDTSGFSFSRPDADMGKYGWTKVGTAQIRVELVSSDALISNKIDALQAAIRNTEAEAQAKVTELKGQIQQLLAITHQPGEI